MSDTLISLLIVVAGNVSAIVAGAVYIDRRFRRLETDFAWIVRTLEIATGTQQLHTRPPRGWSANRHP